MITGLVLAGGPSARHGQLIAEARLGGRRLIDRAVYTLRSGGCDEVVAVIGSGQLQVDGARTVTQSEPGDGIGPALRAGLAAAHPDTEAVVLSLVGQPGIAPTDIRAAIGWYRNGSSIVITRRAGERSHPVLVSRLWFRQLSDPDQGDQSGRMFFAKNYDHIDFIDYDQPMDDIDSPEALERAERKLNSQS